MDARMPNDPQWPGSASYVAGDNRSMAAGLAAASTHTLPRHGAVASPNHDVVDGTKYALHTPKEPSEGTAYNSDADDAEKHAHETIEELETTRTRRIWAFMTWTLTWWIPSPFLSLCGRMKRPDVRMAWREKVAICMIIFFIWCVLLFVIIGLGLILCPKEHVWTLEDVAGHNSEKDAYIALRGRVYDVTQYLNQKHGVSSFVASKDLMVMFAGQDVNASFPIAIRTACPSLVSQKADPQFSMYLTDADPTALQTFPYTHKVGTLPSSTELSDQSFFAKYVIPTLNLFKKGDVVWGYDWVKDMHKEQGKYWRVINKEVFNLENYFATVDSPGNTDKKWHFLDNRIENIFDDKGAGDTDITDLWDRILWPTADSKQANYNCMKNLFYVGKVDDRHSVRCLFANYMLLAFACVLMMMVL
ncbi:hypothetical protein FBU59_000410, partial [Linderina macrospora]